VAGWQRTRFLLDGARSAFHGSVASVCRKLARGRDRTPRLPRPKLSIFPPKSRNVEKLSSFLPSVRKFSPSFHTASILISSKNFGRFSCQTWYPENRGQKRNLRPNRSKTTGRLSRPFPFPEVNDGTNQHTARHPTLPTPLQGAAKRPPQEPQFQLLATVQNSPPASPADATTCHSPPRGEGVSGIGFARKARLRLDSLP
jgi:hypothetical protein